MMWFWFTPKRVKKMDVLVSTFIVEKGMAGFLLAKKSSTKQACAHRIRRSWCLADTSKKFVG